MLKGFLAALFILISLQVGALTRAPSSYIDHDTFVHLSEAEQDKIIIQMMDMMVEMEAGYQREVASANPNPQTIKILQKIVQSMRYLSNLMMAEAEAQTPTPAQKAAAKKKADAKKKAAAKKIADAKKKAAATAKKPSTPISPSATLDKAAAKYSDKYNLAFSGTGPAALENNCIYAGWISQTRMQNGKSLCVHPKTKGIVTDYPTASGCKEPSEIACNPMIFGYTDNKSKPFCVGAGAKSANSSLACKELALTKVKETDGQERLDYLRKAYNANPELYGKLMMNVHQFCLCDSPLHVDEDYRNRIKAHRTCFALMDQYREIRAAGCDVNPPMLDTVELDKMLGKLRDSFGQDTTKKQSQAEIDAVTSVLDNFYKDQLKDGDRQLFCQTDATSPLCKVSECKNATRTCKIEVDKDRVFTDGNKSKVQVFKAGENSMMVELKEAKDKFNNVKIGKVQCDYVSENLDPSCKVSNCKMTEKVKSCDITLTDGTFNGQNTITSQVFTQDQIDLTVVPTSGGKNTVRCEFDNEPTCTVGDCTKVGEDQRCAVSYAFATPTDPSLEKEVLFLKGAPVIVPTKDGKKVTCTLPEKVEQDVLACTANCKLVEKEYVCTLSGSVTVKGTKTDEAVLSKEGNLSEIKFPSDNLPKTIAALIKKDQPVECTVVVDPKGDDETGKIKLNGKKDSVNIIYNIYATVNIGTETFDTNKKLKDGWTVVWYEKDRPEPTEEEKTKKKKEDEEKAKKEKDKKDDKITVAKDSAETDKPKDETKKEEPKKVEGQVQSGTELKYGTSMERKKYQICADLLFNGKVKDTNCSPVPSWNPPTAMPPGMMPMKDSYRFYRAP